MKRYLLVMLGAVLAAAAAVAVVSPSVEISRRGFNSVAGVSSKTIALTIDDGPDPRFTPQILELLAEHHAHATFFLVGESVEQYPQLAREEVAAGHELGNHTMTHPYFDKISYSEAREEIAHAQDAIAQTTGAHPVFVRAPRGATTKASRAAMEDSGLTPAGWSVCIEHHDSPTPEAMAHRVLAQVKPGSIILMHDGRLDRTRSIEALRILLTDLDKEGYTVTTLSTLVDMGTPSNAL